MPKAKKRKFANAKSGKSRASIETQAKHFGEEVEMLGKKIGAEAKDSGKTAEHGVCECHGGYYGAFGTAGLILSVVLGILGLAVSIWALDLLARRTSSVVLLGLHDFLLSNAGVFVLIFLVSSIFTYYRKCCPRPNLLLSPVSTAFGITVFFWFAANVATIANMELGNPELFSALFFVKNNLLGIFWFFLILGYFFVLIRMLFGKAREDTCCRNAAKTPQMAAPEKSGGPKRLYRSGKEKIIAGVCGGIAEYLNVDPVLIRLIWVAFALAGGSGILLYIIAWVVIPRNPNHVWKD